MKIKTIVTTMLVVGTFGATAIAKPNYRVASMLEQLKPAAKVKQISQNKNKSNSLNKKTTQELYFSKNSHEGKKRYIVRLIDDSAASYSGGVKGLEAVNLSTKKNVLNNVAFNPKSTAAKKYISYLDKQQNSFIAKASANVGYSIPNLKSYKFAINGLLTELSFAEAQKIAKMPQVAFIEQDKLFQLNTDTGPLLIGANEIWDGTANGTEYMGEGTIIGVIDTGVNTDHRSFAATGDDGYTVVNPYGDGVYVGDCVADASLCNSKLIGVHSYSSVTEVYSDPLFDAADQRVANGEDHNGHGSHTSSTAGGNVLTGVPFVVSDIAAGNVGDGIETPFIMGTMSGVAPHANIISYQICLPGDQGDTFSGCFSAAGIGAIDDAIQDGVDVINYSIGGTTNFSPWTSATEIGFLSAQAAGIFVATSAGNSGPDANTSTKVSPWYTSVAASNHGNGVVTGGGLTLGTLAGGDTAAPADIAGGGSNGGFSGDMVWAGDFTNANDPAGDPAQCLQPFPAATFTATQIVVCDRGAIARVSKAANVAVAGAGGFVLANLQGGAANIADDFYAVPGIHIDADDGDALRLWLASGTGHTGTISAATLTRGTNTADQIAGFSSRGPNEFAQIITPQIAAPGVSVYAAYADDTPFHDVNQAFPSDFAFLSGTSMASPHMAGSAALMTQAKPTWNPDQIRSALMMTATTVMLKEDGVTPADFFDMGAGRVQVNEAINAGLVMSESQANYLAADPAAGGDPRTLNIPSLANFACSGCSWTRTFTAVSAGTYAFTSPEARLTIEPASITAVAGEDYSVTFTMAVTGSSTGDEVYTTVDIASSASPDLHLPVYVKINVGSIPDAVDIKAGRNDGSYSVPEIQSIPTDNLIVTLNGLFDANATGLVVSDDFDIAVDPTNGTYDDDLSQVHVFEFVVSPNAATLNVRIEDSTSTDNDLFVEIDPNGDGGWTLVGAAATAAANEQLSIATPAPGNYRAIVQNWASTSGQATDTGTLSVEVVPITDPLPGLTVDAPTTADGLSPLGIRLVWDREMSVGDSFTGDVSVYADTTFIGNFPITLERVENDVSMSSSTVGPVARGDTIDYTVVVNRNLYNDDLGYTLSVDMPEGSSLLPGSVVASDGTVVIKDPNAEGLDLEDGFDIAEDPTNGTYDDDLSQVFVREFDVPNGTLDMRIAISASTSPDNDLFVEFDPNGDGGWTLVTFAATAGANESVTIDAPAAGKWRAIVQNWAGSAAATDTGTLSITSNQAKGEGFIWSAVSELAFDAFSVVSSADEPMCAAAGFGGYVDLGSPAIGISTVGVTGDTVAFSVFAGTNFSFFGEDHDGLVFTDDGFTIFSGGTGPNPWVNTAIPNDVEPNDMIALFWKDLEIFDDGTRGIRLAGITGVVQIIDFDEIGSFGDDTDRFSFDLQAWLGTTDAPGDYEYIVGYSATQVGDFTGATAGVENPDGSAGTDASSLIEPGVQLCYDAVQAGDEFEITFSVLTTAASVGNPITPTVTVQTDLPGTNDWTIDGAPVSLVNVAPIANAGPDITFNRGEITAGQVNLDGSATSDLDRDQLLFVWTQTSGDEIPLHGAGTGRPFFNLSEVANGSYTFNMVVSDGEFSDSDEVTIAVEGTSAVTGLNGSSFGSGGSIGGLLLIIMGITFFNRRRLLK